MHKHPRGHKNLSLKKIAVLCVIALATLGMLWYFFLAGVPDPGFMPRGFRGPGGAPHVNGPTGSPPNY